MHQLFIQSSQMAQAGHFGGQMEWMFEGQSFKCTQVSGSSFVDCRSNEVSTWRLSIIHMQGIYAPTSSGRRSPYMCVCGGLIHNPSLPLFPSPPLMISWCVYLYCVFVTVCRTSSGPLFPLHQVLVIRCLLTSSVCVVHICECVFESVHVFVCGRKAQVPSLLCIRSL